MRVLFQMPYPGYLRFYGGTLRELTERGHEVLVAYDSDKHRTAAATAVEERAGVRLVGAVPHREGRGAQLIHDLRLVADYLRYLDPRFAEADTLRRRMDKFLPERASRLSRAPRLPGPVVRALLGLYRLVERAVPSATAVEAYLREHAPDCVVVTPLVARGPTGAHQTDTVKSARALSIPAACAVSSWDHLTSKGLIKGSPDRVILWNAAQRDEAIELHGMDPARIEITGAQAFDQWFERTPSSDSTAFCASLGLPGDRPYVLYVGSSPNITPAERDIAFVREWVAALRQSDDLRLREASVLVRPHPGNTADWARADLSGLERVAVSPRVRPSIPMSADEEAHYFDSLHHSAAVVGINTSAMIEAGIVGRPVHTIRGEGFDDTQEGTLHFQLLVGPGSGGVREARGMAQHLEQLAEALADPAGMAAQAEGFVRSFVRPRGLERPAREIVADAVERLASSPGSPARTRAPGSSRPSPSAPRDPAAA